MKAVQIISGTAVPLDRSDVDTDQIIPSDWLKRVERTGFEKGLFSEWRDDPAFVMNQEQYQGASILVAGPNFGTGSSREHAVWAISQYGFLAVISPRFGDIFRNNALKNGLLPIVLDEAIVQELMLRPDDVLHIDVAGNTLRTPDGRRFAFPLDAFARTCLLEGVDEMGYLLARADAISTFEQRREQELAHAG